MKHSLEPNYDGFMAFVYAMIVFALIVLMVYLFHDTTGEPRPIDCTQCHSELKQLHDVTKSNIARNGRKYLK